MEQTIHGMKQKFTHGKQSSTVMISIVFLAYSSVNGNNLDLVQITDKNRGG